MMKIEIENIEEFNGLHIWVEADGSLSIECNTEKWRFNLEDIEAGRLHIYHKCEEQNMTNEVKIVLGAVGVAIIIIAIDLLFLKMWGYW